MYLVILMIDGLLFSCCCILKPFCYWLAQIHRHDHCKASRHCRLLSICVWYQACKEFSAAWIIAGVFYGVYFCLWHKWTDVEVLECHSTWSDQCVKPIRLACEFNITVMLSWRMRLLWPVHPRAISNIKGIYVPYDALCCILYNGRQLWYRHCT